MCERMWDALEMTLDPQLPRLGMRGAKDEANGNKAGKR